MEDILGVVLGAAFVVAGTLGIVFRRRLGAWLEQYVVREMPEYYRKLSRYEPGRFPAVVGAVNISSGAIVFGLGIIYVMSRGA
jgi:hypothetical protein